MARLVEVRMGLRLELEPRTRDALIALGWTPPSPTEAERGAALGPDQLLPLELAARVRAAEATGHTVGCMCPDCDPGTPKEPA